MPYTLKLPPRFWLLASLISGAALAEDANRSCTVVGQVSPVVEIRECLQNNGMDQEAFEEFCNRLMSSLPSFKVTYVKSCPVQIRGTCEDAYGRPITAYFLDARGLDEVRRACTTSGGHWLTNGFSASNWTGITTHGSEGG